MNEGVSPAFAGAVAELWRLPPPGPDNLLSDPAFLRLREAAVAAYPQAGRSPTFSLGNALRSLGLPYQLPPSQLGPSISADDAAEALHRSFQTEFTIRRHLLPLDLAGDLPLLRFGPARIERFDAAELRGLVDAARLARIFPNTVFDAERFAQFHWLVIEERIHLDREPEARALPVLLMDMRQDLGRIEPHKPRFPPIVEDTLFALLLAPWESWSTMLEVDWRGFRTPWVFTVDNDLFVRPPTPPSPDTLNWEPRVYDDGDGGTFEVERPLELRLADDAAAGLSHLNDNRWTMIEQARRSPLFETPIAHFFVGAFLAKGMDEVLAHLTAIEAGIGLRSDYDRRMRPSPDRHARLSATKRNAARIATLLADKECAVQYEHLFGLRSAFLHGRNMGAISTKDRVLARSLTRRVVEALADAGANMPSVLRESFLDDLLNRNTTFG